MTLQKCGRNVRPTLLVPVALLALASGLVVLLLQPPFLQAQSKLPKPSESTPSQIGPTLKVEVRAVLVDVVVTNKKGEPVAGLPAKDFEVMEDGAPQTISFFEEHAQPVPAPAQVSTAPLPPNEYTSSQTVKSSDSVNVLLLDWLNTQPQDQSYVREQVIKYLRTVPPGTRLAIFELGTDLRIVQGFTSESSLLMVALQDKKAGANPRSLGLLATETRKASEQELVDLMVKSDAAPAAVDAVKDTMAANASKQSGDRVKLTMQALLELEHYLSPIPGRKNVFWFSGSFPISFFPGAGPDANFGSQLQQTAEQFGPDRIAIYPISAEGIKAAGDFDPSQGLEGRARMHLPDPSQDSTEGERQVAMESLAKETGGEAFLNSNSFDRNMKRALDYAAHYYTLSYAPSNARMDGKFRNIQVKLASGNYRLSYRRGYYAEPPTPPASITQSQENDRLLGLMRFGMPDFDQIAYQVRVAPEQPQPVLGAPRAGVNTNLQGSLTRYSVDYLIPMKSLKLEAASDGSRKGFIELMLIAYEKNGNPLNLVMSKEEIKLPAQVVDSGKNIEIHARQEIDVPVGFVYLRTGFYEQSSGNVGTIGVPLNSPNVAAASKK
ncbi:MAG TPA: VWA domain-containing protein [Candidatus Solibacter sp.]|nr:VWA domain-containing protein [Candidatus Solibacter sp.]